MADDKLKTYRNKGNFGAMLEPAGARMPKGPSTRIDLLWRYNDDHDLKPRKSISDLSTADHLKTMAQSIGAWAKRIVS